MERLTEKQSSGYDLKAMNGEYCNRYCEQQRVETCNECVIYQAIQKLAEYEDFEEIFREKMTDTACEFLKDKEEFGKWLDRNKWITKKCDEYARAEEQGLLLRLPCGIGDDVYFIPSETNYKLNILQGCYESNRVYHQNVEKMTFTPNGWYLECDKDIEYATDHILIDKLYKETWFLTKAEAEQKLKEMGV